MRRALSMLALLAVSGCAHDPHRYGDGYGPGSDGGYGYQGDEWSGRELDDLFRPDPWLEDTREGRVILDRALGGRAHPEAVRDLNIRFRRFADTDRDLALTDREIRLALVRCSVHGWSW